MAEEPIAFLRAAVSPSSARSTGNGQGSVPQVRFDRGELHRILTVYGRMVSAGEWRDYAIDFLNEVAVFSVYRRSSELPLYRIEKRPALRARQGQYSVIATGNQILKRGHELANVLRVFDKKLLKALSAE